MLPKPGEPLVAGVHNARDRKNFAIFDWIRHLSQKLYEIGSCLMWNVDRKSLVVDRPVLVQVSLSDLQRRDARGEFLFRRDSLIPLVLFDPGRTTDVGERRISTRSLQLRRYRYIGAGPQRSSVLGNAHTLWRRTAKFDALTQACFRRSTTLPPQGGRAPSAPDFGGSFLFMRTPFVVKLPNLTW